MENMDAEKEPTNEHIEQATKEIELDPLAEENRKICCCGNSMGERYSCDNHTPVSMFDRAVYNRAKELANKE
jgi:hypothetical protein